VWIGRARAPPLGLVWLSYPLSVIAMRGRMSEDDVERRIETVCVAGSQPSVEGERVPSKSVLSGFGREPPASGRTLAILPLVPRGRDVGARGLAVEELHQVCRLAAFASTEEGLE